MINKSDIKKFARTVFKGHKRPKNPELMHPNREWIIGLFIALIMFGVTAAWSAQTYLEYREVSIGEGQQAQETVVVYRESVVNAALEIFSERENVLTALLSSTQPIVPEPVPVVEDEFATSSDEIIEQADELSVIDEIGTTTASSTVEVE